jgi:hypothetical protein
MTISRLPTQFPHDEGMGPNARQTLDQMLLAINQLMGQGPKQPGTGIGSLVVNTVNPTTSQITSQGNRVGSLTTPLIFDGGAGGSTSVTFYWDGSHTSSQFTIYRDDGTTTGPIPGSLTVTGLVAATLYFFYPYFDETLGSIQFAVVSGVSKGTPPIAFLAKNAAAIQQQILRGRLPLAPLLGTAGVTTGAGMGSGGSGGGAGAGGGGGHSL